MPKRVGELESIRRINKIENLGERMTALKAWGHARIENYFKNPKYSIYTRFKMLDSKQMQGFITPDLRKELAEELKVQMQWDYLKLIMKNAETARNKFQEAVDAGKEWAIKEILNTGSKFKPSDVQEAGQEFEALIGERQKRYEREGR